MVRWLSAVFGVGLVILGVSELNGNTAPWLAWFDFIAAIASFGLAVGLNKSSSHAAHISGPFLMALCLCTLGTIAFLANAAPPSPLWWNFGFAVAFFLTGLETALSGHGFRSEITPYDAPYASHSSRAFGAGYPYSWEPYGLMGISFDYSPTQTGHKGRGPRNYKRSDLRIEEDVNDRLTDHWGIDASDITVQVKNQEVWLQGQVDNRRAKRIAEELAESVSGVRDVKNELQMRGKGAPSEIKVA